MYPKVFEIRLDDESKRFYPGQVIAGKVIVVLQKEKIVRGIVIRLFGKGYVYWDTGAKHYIFTESEVYVNHCQQLYVPEDGRQSVLPPGSYEYLFTLQLPQSIPGSVEGQHGFVRYYLEAAIQRPWKDDQIQEAVIHVTSMLDLSNYPETVEPASIQKEKHVGFNICQTGPIMLNFMMGKTGFVPGEYLQFGVEIRNASSTRINRVHISLKRHFNCHAQGETKASHEKFVTVNGPATEPGGYLLWQSNFEVPMLPPSEVPGCSIISIEYFVEVKLALEKWADIKCHQPIKIGTLMSNVKPFGKLAEAIAYPETPSKKPKSRTGSLVRSRKSSVVKSPITGEEFTYDPEEDWEEQKHGQVISTSPPTHLPPLDLVFFQHKLEKTPFFKYYEDFHCENAVPFGFSSVPNVDNEKKQPPRPHSNPGQYLGKKSLWFEDE